MRTTLSVHMAVSEWTGSSVSVCIHTCWLEEVHSQARPDQGRVKLRQLNFEVVYNSEHRKSD